MDLFLINIIYSTEQLTVAKLYSKQFLVQVLLEFKVYGLETLFGKLNQL